MTSSFTLQSSSLKPGSIMPAIYTCDGDNRSPALEFTNIPPNAKSLVLIVSDPDAPSGTFYHWIIYNMPPTMNGLKEGETDFPDGVIIGKNDFSNNQYDGPCPPKGPAHHYFFTLYALNTILSFPSGNANAQTILPIMKQHVIEKTDLIVQYKR